MNFMSYRTQQTVWQWAILAWLLSRFTTRPEGWRMAGMKKYKHIIFDMVTEEAILQSLQDTVREVLSL